MTDLVPLETRPRPIELGQFRVGPGFSLDQCSTLDRPMAYKYSWGHFLQGKFALSRVQHPNFEVMDFYKKLSTLICVLTTFLLIILPITFRLLAFI